jgi:hypothetical protein
VGRRDFNNDKNRQPGLMKDLLRWADLIGGIAGGDTLRLRKALLVIPASAVLMLIMSLIMIALHIT